jgi:membrane protease subunit HflK
MPKPPPRSNDRPHRISDHTMFRRLLTLMSLNDPQWGRKGGNQGPPDLEELWRKANQRLAGLFGGRRGGGGGGGGDSGPPDFRQMSGGAAILAGVVLAVWLASGFFIVDQSQRAVVLTFGRFSQIVEPGLQWRLPFPMQSHEIVNVSQVRTIEVGYRNTVKTKVLKEALMLTDDENIIDIQFAVQYTLKDIKDYLFNNRLPDDSVLQAAETAFREIVGKSKMDFVLYEGREQVAVAAQRLMQDILDRYKTGIQVQRVTMQNAQPPEQVQAAFDDAVKAGQDRERQKNEGQAYANDVIPKARGTASRLIQEADGYRQRVIATAEGDASRFKQVLVEYSKAPAVTRDRMYLDAMQQIMTNTTKVMLDVRAGGNLLYLPLDKLMQMGGAATAPAPDAAPTVKPSPSEPAVTPDTSSRSRDALRGREREGR